VYLSLSAGYTFAYYLVVAVNLIFQTQDAQLNPFRLVLVGTALEVTRTLCEVPTGVIADVVSRRLSILVGLVIMGSGLMLSGAFTNFETIVLGHVVWGLGYTFISGAREAWIADEIGPANAAKLFPRATQVELIALLAATPVSVAIGTLQLNLPILIGGALFFPLTLFLMATMTETGFRRRSAGTARTLTEYRRTLSVGIVLVRITPWLGILLAITCFYGMSSEGFQRLMPAHFYSNLGFPALGNLEPVVWFGVLRVGSSLLSLLSVEITRRRIDLVNQAAVFRALFVLYLLLCLSLFVFAAAGSFWAGVFAAWSVIALSNAYQPLRLAWINQNVDSAARATVISMSGLVSSGGEIFGGPITGAVGAIASLRAAMYTSAAALIPGVLLYIAALRVKPARAVDLTPAG
jgi:DHA3 family tetracycline resistance protein-like MFS transporter